MTVLAEMYETAYLNDIVVDCVKLHKTASLSLMDDDGDCFIALDPYRLGSEQNEVLQIAHELGHCMTGSFYNRYSSLNCISQEIPSKKCTRLRLCRILLLPRIIPQI